MIGKAILFSSFLINTAVSAEQLNVEYSSFYTHVKKIDKEDTNKLRFAFGFKHIAHDRLCKIDDAKIVTQKQTLPLQVENATRFTVPVDKVLKMAKALVTIQIDDNANQCDMSVQLETLPEYLKQTYTHAELQALLVQYQDFFSNMGSFMSFMMPSAEGLVFHFDKNEASFHILEKQVDSSGNLTLDQVWFDKNQGKGLNLPSTPIRVTALVVK
jgi:hypothetical protein